MQHRGIEQFASGKLSVVVVGQFEVCASRAYPTHVYPYPACSKKFAHSWSVKERTIRPILRQSPSIVRSAALRRCAFTLLKPCSIGLKSGEYGGRYCSRAPTASIASRTPGTL